MDIQGLHFLRGEPGCCEKAGKFALTEAVLEEREIGRMPVIEEQAAFELANGTEERDGDEDAAAGLEHAVGFNEEGFGAFNTVFDDADGEVRIVVGAGAVDAQGVAPANGEPWIDRSHEVNKFPGIFEAFDGEALTSQGGDPVPGSAACFEMHAIGPHGFKQYFAQLVLSKVGGSGGDVIAGGETGFPVRVPVLLVARLAIPCYAPMRDVAVSILPVGFLPLFWGLHGLFSHPGLL